MQTCLSINKNLSSSSLEILRVIKTTPNFAPTDERCVNRFLYWLNNRKEWYVLVERRGIEGKCLYNRDFKYFRVYCRFDREYAKRTIRKFNQLKAFAADRSFVHIVLTIEHGTCSIWQSIQKIKTNWNKLRALLKKQLGKNYPFLAVLEPHQDGYPHLHILYFTDHYLIEQNKLSKWCKEHNLGRVVYIKRYWANGFRKKPIFYLAKYLRKYANKESWGIGEFVFYACMFSLNAKSYTFSHDFRLAKPKISNWKLVKIGTIDGIKRAIELRVEIGLYSLSYPLINMFG